MASTPTLPNRTFASGSEATPLGASGPSKTLPPLPAALATAGAAERLRILTDHKTIAMVGLSADPMRPSHFAAIYMLAEGYDVIPVNPRYAGQAILGQPVYASLAEIPRPVGIVDVFRKPQDVPPIAEEAIRIGAPVLWLQLGVVNEEAAATARAAGLDVVMDRCVKIEHARFFGGLNLVGMNTGVVTARRTVG
ncbi:MAG: CoA-binding domain protein [uncultured Thermomicrobiales bacterium]|uniref:CoA-binding domain protein n=1 Tax=uncultured Thermomicrobiales bacterium TaxID=1645740 RepID=A0A6J4VQA2_9BACT|nr:MAG: CoA-binding domain protein [uncultured Thermomicrobiales bacterium]